MDYSNRPARLVAVCVDKGVHVYDIARREKLAEFFLTYQVTCLNLSNDGLEMLVNLGCDEVWAIDLESGEPRQRYKGQKQGNFVIRSCFGGASEGFVVSGGEGKPEPSSTLLTAHDGQMCIAKPLQTPRSPSGTATPAPSSKSSQPTPPAASTPWRGTQQNPTCSPQQAMMPVSASGSLKLGCKLRGTRDDSRTVRGVEMLGMGR